MTYRKFKLHCHPGSQVTDGNRYGQVFKLRQDREKALVSFDDGMTEWIEYYKLELTNEQ